MSIAIVSALPSALPSATPTASTNTAVDATTQGVAPDFISLLFGQLTAAMNASEALSGKAPVADDHETSDASLPEDEAAQSGDAQNLLAVLAQAPLEQRSANVPATASAQQAEAGATEGIPTQRPAWGDKELAVAERAAPETSPTPVDARATAESDVPAAKFAAPAMDVDAARGDKPAASIDSAAPAMPGTPTMTDVRHHNENAVPRLAVNTPVNDRAWNDDFAQKITWLAGQHKQSAELTLNPPSMGNIEISLKLDRETSSATATFVSGNVEVRETIESALPRLREMLAGVGIELGQAQVSAESFRQSNGNESRQENGASQSRSDVAILATDSLSAQRAVSAGSAGRGLVDIFA